MMMSAARAATVVGFFWSFEIAWAAQVLKNVPHVGASAAKPSALAQQGSRDVPGFDKPWAIDHQRCVTGFFRVGCFSDQQTEQRRFYDKLVPKEDREPMTVEVCWNFCRNVSGAQYFGLQNGRECYCTPAFDSFSGGNDDTLACDSPCDGNPSQTCGGNGNQNIYEMHDCNNLPPVPCKTPPTTVASAKLFYSKYYRMETPCQNTMKGPLDTKGNQGCEIECEDGYVIAMNDLKCQELGDRLVYSWAQLVGQAACAAVNCGVPPVLDHMTCPRSDIKFPNKAMCQCDLGYSLNGTAHGKKQQQVQCLATGGFAEVQPCLPIGCGLCPSGEKYANTRVREGTHRVFRDMCTYDCNKGHTLDARPDGQKEYAIACQFTGEFEEPPSCLPVFCETIPSVPFAENKRALQSIPVYMEQVPFQCENGYTLDSYPGGEANFLLTCQEDGKFSQPPQCKPVRAGNPPYVANAIYLDRVYFYGESCTYTCEVGYTHDGKVDGLDQFTNYVTAEGRWKDKAPKCLPVECGAVPQVDHSSANGTYPASVNFDTPAIQFVCHAGYSLTIDDDIWEPKQNTFFVNCLATGHFHTESCVNIDDCVTRNCGPHGTCEDLPSPGPEPLNNYKCNCESGYESTQHPSTWKEGALMHRCTDINDCPVKDPCGGYNSKNATRGTCVDHLNDYECVCGAGYQLVTMEGMPRNQTCQPVSCGAVPSTEFAKSTPDQFGQVVNYDTPAWNVGCEEGYSLDGTANGPATYEMTCTSTGSLSPEYPCKPMSCGAPPFVGNADMAPKFVEIVFKESVTYTCDEGYALKGDAKGLRVFEVACLSGGVMSLPDTSPGGEKEPPTVAPPADGQPKAGTNTTTTTPLACLPVICGHSPQMDHATWNTTKVYVFPQIAGYRCDTGYSIDGSASTDKDSFEFHCQSSGEFSSGDSCQRVKCPAPSDYPYTTHTPSGPYAYGDTVTYTIEPGHEVVDASGKVINGSFMCVCDANGKFNGTCASDVESRPHDCGPAPEVAFATVSGSTIFGGHLVATADKGFTLDGTPEGRTNFEFHCMADGRFSERLAFEPIQCGLCANYANVAEVILDPADHTAALLETGSVGSARAGHLKVRSLSGRDSVQFQRKARRSGKRLFETVYADEVTYVCQEGYRAADGTGMIPAPVVAVPTTAPTDFRVKCEVTGDFVLITPTAVRSQACVPVTCDVHMPLSSAISFPRLANGGDFDRRIYTEKQTYICREGYSLDAKPSGEVEYEEECLASGYMSETHACQDIDYCLISQCGESGRCTDGALAYTCSCDPGYEVSLVDARWEKCVQILECDTQRGHESCSVGGGVCVDETLKYACHCTEGYENVAIAGGLDSCAPVVCGAAPMKEHGSSPMQAQKLSYPQTATYTCNPGFTTNGKKDGPSGFAISCTSSATLAGDGEECRPVECAKAATIPNGDITGADTVVYPQSVNYTCHAGYTTSGFASGSKSFESQCLADGELAEPQVCSPVSCGIPDTFPSATSSSTSESFFGGEVVYTCSTGYTLDGTAAGEKTFTTKCEASGVFTGVRTCEAVTCGKFEGVAHGSGPITEHSFPQSLSVTCLTGYTVDADPDGESTFKVDCGADGKYIGVKECKPVSCGTPAATAGATSSDSAKVYLEVATWTCNTGYSTSGFPGGGTSFSKLCDAAGSYGAASPADCTDINFCADSPCGTNGACKDAGAGVPYPGYTCTCFEGFEVRKNPDGSDMCSADDCTGAPCGEGGSCIDLSKVGGPQNAYSCTCSPGYKLIELETGKFTCQRNRCGVLPKVTHSQNTASGAPYEVAAWKGKAVELDPFTGSPVLNSYDVAIITCAEGYSTDGRAVPEAKDFAISCEHYGAFSRAIKPEEECIPVVCNDPFLPSISKATVINKAGTFKYGQKAKFQCIEGHTTTGGVSAPSSFEIACLSSGTFETEHPQCFPVTCPAPTLANAYTSTAAFKFGEVAIYTCNSGHYIGGSPTGSTTFQATCTAAGTASSPYAGCSPVLCSGTLPAQPNAALTSAPAAPVILGNNYRYTCNSGCTMGGTLAGDTSYQITCLPSGAFSGSVPGAPSPGGPPGGNICIRTALPVSGIVSDAQKSLASGGAIQGAKVEFVLPGGSPIAAFSTADGSYEAKVPPGTYMMSVSKSGYVTYRQEVIVASATSGVNAALSTLLADDEWRIVLTWGAQPKDLDSHTYFGCNFDQHVSYQATSATSDRAGGLKVTLDRDSVDGFGPETTSIRNANKCTQVGCCLIQFKVHHYSGSSTLGASGAKVTVYKGSAVYKTYTVPACVGSEVWWTVLTIDSTTGMNTLYEGAKRRAPYITGEYKGTTSWATSFDSPQWSQVSAPSGRLAIASGLNLVDATALHRLDAATYYEVRGGSDPTPPSTCQEVDWNNALKSQSWALCPAGSYVVGLYRTGSKYDAASDGLEQMTKARCCFPEQAPGTTAAWGTCYDKAVPASGMLECSPTGGQQTAIAGLHTLLNVGAPLPPGPAGPSVKHTTTGNGVYLEAKYVALGVRTTSEKGKFGTDGMPPGDFATRKYAAGVGMLADVASFAADPAKTWRLEFFLPGSPAESFKVGMRIGGSRNDCSNCAQTVTDTSTGGMGGVRIDNTFSHLGATAAITQDVSLSWDAMYFKTVVTIKNTGGTKIDQFRYMRTVDPDNTVDVGGDYTTEQRIEGTIAADGYAMVSATSRAHDAYYYSTGGKRAVLAYFSDDTRARTSFGLWGLDPANVWDSRCYEDAPAKGSSTVTDAYIAITFDIANLGPGQSTTFTYFTSLDSKPVAEIKKELEKASKPVLVIDKLKCCALRPAGLMDGAPTCPSMML